MSRRGATILRWASLALVGLALAVAVGIAAGKLTSQPIGLSSEPLQAGEALAPKPTGDVGGTRGHGGRHGGGNVGGNKDPQTTTAPQTTTTPETTTAPQTTTSGDSGDDSSGGEGSDDD